MANLEVLSPPSPTAVARDILVRAVKTAITTFVGVVGANVAGWTNLDGLKAAGITALAAAASVVVNVILSWANSP